MEITVTESTFAANEYNFVANYFAAEIKEFKSRQVKKKLKHNLGLELFMRYPSLGLFSPSCLLAFPWRIIQEDVVIPMNILYLLKDSTRR